MQGADLSTNPRKLALDILIKLDGSSAPLDPLLDSVLNTHPDMPMRDKALFFSLVYGVLRWKGRIDWIISAFSTIKLPKIDPAVLNILRISLFQIMFTDRIPVSAAVNTAVEMAKQKAGPWVVKYVNGVLRKASREYRNVPFPVFDADPVQALAVSESFPPWLVKRWLNRFGMAETKLLLAAMNDIPRITIRTNTLKTNRETLLNVLKGDCRDITLSSLTPEGLSIASPRLPLTQMDSFQNGWFAVQDEAAQMVSHLARPKEGETVIDACAGLGGKTGHIAQLMQNYGQVIAIDRNSKKLSALRDEMHRLGVTIVTTQPADLLSTDLDRLPKADKILLDAPCSGLGVIKRNPDTKWRIKPESFPALSKTQLELLNRLAGVVKPGGVLIYAVCSMEPEETDVVMEAFLNAHSEFSMEGPDPSDPAWIKEVMDQKGCLRTFPHQHNMDGFFSARLRKAG